VDRRQNQATGVWGFNTGPAATATETRCEACSCHETDQRKNTLSKDKTIAWISGNEKEADEKNPENGRHICVVQKVIAVDFDGCLCKQRWPAIGEANEKLIISLIQARKDGHKLILYTCREGKRLCEAVVWCREHGLVFDAVNENLPERIAKYGGDCRKISADIYLDDNAFRVRA